MHKNITRVVLLLAILALGGMAAGFAWYQHVLDTPNTQTSPTTFIIEKGTSSRSVAERLAQQQLIANAFVLKVAIKLNAGNYKIIAGEYAIPPQQTPLQILALFASGKVVSHSLTIPEGLTSQEIIQLLDNEPLLTGDTPAAEEGSLLPETYAFTRGESRSAVLTRMREAMQRTLQRAWANRDQDIPLKTPQEALILASIVEKETGLASERPRIAGVFINRLRLGMRLQSDPTTIYGIYAETGTKKRVLSRADLARSDAYNTYVIPALPPTPIANPGKEAIEAVMHPLSSNELYFVATGTGGHTFSASLEEHNRAVSNLRAHERAATSAPEAR